VSESIHILCPSFGYFLLFLWGVPDSLQTVYGFEPWQCGLIFLSLLRGVILAVLSDPFWRSNYCRLEKNLNALYGESSESNPELRLPPGTSCEPYFLPLVRTCWSKLK
jgi:hypothetical protein